MKDYSRRRVGGRRPYKILVIVCEGAKTEQTYFKHYRDRGKNLKIETPNTKKTDPIGLVKFARRQIDRYDLNIRSGDQIWCVFDADHNSDQQISTACQMASPDIHIALSNPSFELWYLLHFAYDESRISNTDLAIRLRRHLSEFTKTQDVFSDLEPRRIDAIRNAKKLNAYHKRRLVILRSTNSNPSTQVYRIVGTIQSMKDRFAKA